MTCVPCFDFAVFIEGVRSVLKALFKNRPVLRKSFANSPVRSGSQAKNNPDFAHPLTDLASVRLALSQRLRGQPLPSSGCFSTVEERPFSRVFTRTIRGSRVRPASSSGRFRGGCTDRLHCSSPRPLVLRRAAQSAILSRTCMVLPTQAYLVYTIFLRLSRVFARKFSTNPPRSRAFCP